MQRDVTRLGLDREALAPPNDVAAQWNWDVSGHHAAVNEFYLFVVIL